MAAIASQIFPTQIPFGHVESIDIHIKTLALVSMVFKHRFVHPHWGPLSVDLIKPSCCSPLIQIRRNQNQFQVTILNDQKQSIDFSGEPLIGEDQIVFDVLNTQESYFFPILRNYSPNTHYECSIPLAENYNELPLIENLSLMES